jgi:hypothetical protein
MKKLIRILFSIPFLVHFDRTEGQELFLDNGVYAEKVIKGDSSSHRYSVDNGIFKIYRVFTYRCTYEAAMPVIGTDSLSLGAIDSIQLTVTDDLHAFLPADSQYSQTVIRYDCFDYSGKLISSEETGVIDNRMNIWLHPPRSGDLRILEINPFPFVLWSDTMQSWNWPLSVWESWSDRRWKTWTGILKIKNSYEKFNNEVIATKWGRLECRVINAVGFSIIGKTSLRTYFHPVYGFLRLEYETINGARLILQLVDMRDP